MQIIANIVVIILSEFVRVLIPSVILSTPSMHEHYVPMRYNYNLSGNSGESLVITICHSTILVNVSVRAGMGHQRAYLSVEILCGWLPRGSTSKLPRKVMKYLSGNGCLSL